MVGAAEAEVGSHKEGASPASRMNKPCRRRVCIGNKRVASEASAHISLPADHAVTDDDEVVVVVVVLGRKATVARSARKPKYHTAVVTSGASSIAQYIFLVVVPTKKTTVVESFWRWVENIGGVVLPAGVHGVSRPAVE